MAKTPDNKLYNSATVFYNGNRVADYRKQHLPNYGVFDEKRYFTAGDEVCVFELGNVPTALCICEDAWFPGVVETSAQHGAQCVLNLNASPYYLAKIQRRETAIRERIATAGIPMFNVNLIGGQDELIFDGASFVMDASGKVTARAAEFEESLLVCDLELNGNTVSLMATECRPADHGIESIYKGLVLGIRDYVQKQYHGHQ